MIKKSFLNLILIIWPILSTAQNTDILEHKVITEETVMLREKCLSKTFSFCSDGYEQPYRMYPYFIKMDSLNNDLKTLYSKGVFMFVPFNETETVLKKCDDFKNDWKLDSLFHKKSSSKNTISIYNKELKKKVRHYYRKNNIEKKFDGFLMFDAFKMKISYFHVGKKKIIIPNDDKNFKSILIDELEVDVFYIINIQEVTPLNLTSE